MGKGIDLAREHAPEHAELLDNFKDQFLIVLVNRLSFFEKDGVVTIPIKEVDDTGGLLLSMSITDGSFNFKVSRKH